MTGNDDPMMIRRGVRWTWLLAALMVCFTAYRVMALPIDQATPSNGGPGASGVAIDPHGGRETMPLPLPAAGSMGQGTGAGGGAAPAAGDLRSFMPSSATEAPDSPARRQFAAAVVLDQFRLLAIQNRDQVKVLDSWARQSLSTIRNRQSIDGEDPLFTVLDMAIRPGVWQDKNIIYVQAVPVREALASIAGNGAGGGAEEAKRIMQQGLVSPAFLERENVSVTLEQVALDTRRSRAVQQVNLALFAFRKLADSFVIMPPSAEHRAQPWHHPVELIANLPDAKDREAEFNLKNLPVLSDYSAAQALRAQLAMQQLWTGWWSRDVALTNSGMVGFLALAPSIDPVAYPSEAKRVTEVWYNRTFYGTIANVFLYFLAMVLFLMVGVGVASPKSRIERTALVIFTIAVALHLTSMGIRYWLADRWPTQNQFESVLGAALLGCLMGWVLEMRKRSGLFGMAFSFVGFLAMTACMAAPYMFGRDIGGAIEKTTGILQTYWLKIHVNVVISSYALIAASFVIGALYLITRQWHWINPIEPGFDGDDSQGGRGPTGGGSGGAVAITDGSAGPTVLAMARASELEAHRTARLDMLDQANMVVLQMAMWFLGIGIICGAVWADQSWGRPWGWDPKETFALVTWLVYLIIVHLRFVIRGGARADVTAWMSIAGFAIMMFNWIGVNYFLVGLHSYA